MRRMPSVPAISISAFRQRSAGGVSPENAAQHFVPPGATWQRSPSFLMQHPQPLRHVSDWLYQRQRVSRQMFPFALFAYAGAAIWAGTFIGLGYLLGERWKAVQANIDHYLVGCAIALVVLAAAY